MRIGVSIAPPKSKSDGSNLNTSPWGFSFNVMCLPEKPKEKSSINDATPENASRYVILDVKYPLVSDSKSAATASLAGSVVEPFNNSFIKPIYETAVFHDSSKLVDCDLLPKTVFLQSQPNDGASLGYTPKSNDTPGHFKIIAKRAFYIFMIFAENTTIFWNVVNSSYRPVININPFPISTKTTISFTNFVSNFSNPYSSQREKEEESKKALIKSAYDKKILIPLALMRLLANKGCHTDSFVAINGALGETAHNVKGWTRELSVIVTQYTISVEVNLFDPEHARLAFNEYYLAKDNQIKNPNVELLLPVAERIIENATAQNISHSLSTLMEMQNAQKTKKDKS